MSLTKQIAHNTIIQITGKIISTLLGLVAIGMMLRYLPKEQFGWYTTAITFLQFAGILIDFGLIPVTAQMLGQGKCDQKKLFQNLLGFRFVTALIFFIVTPLLALFFPYPREVKYAIALAAISFLSISMNQILIGYYQAKLKMHIQVIGENVGRIVLIFGLYFLMERQTAFLPIIGVIVVSAMAYTAVLWIQAARETPTGFAYDKEIWKTIAKNMWPIAISIIFNVIYLKGDTILLTLYRSQSEIAEYGAAYRVIDIISQLAMMMMGVMLPILAGTWATKAQTEFKKRYQQSFDVLMLFALPITIGTMLLAEPIMELVGGTKYVNSGEILRILAIAVFGLYLGAVFGHTAVAINRQKATMWIYISDAVITFTGYLIFIPLYGLWGAAWITVFSELYAGILLWLTIRHYVDVGLSWVTFGKILLASAAMGLAILFLQPLPTLLIILTAIIIYCAVLYLTKAVAKETIQEVLSIK